MNSVLILNSFYMAVFKFNYYFHTTPKLNPNNYLPYSLIKWEKIESYKLIPSYKVTINDIQRQMNVQEFKRISAHVAHLYKLNANKAHNYTFALTRTAGHGGGGDPRAIEEGSITEHRRKLMCGLSAKSSLAGITKNELLHDRDVSTKDLGTVKYNLWFYRIADEHLMGDAVKLTFKFIFNLK